MGVSSSANTRGQVGNFTSSSKFYLLAGVIQSDVQLLLPREVAKSRPCTSQSFPPLCSSKRALPFIRLRLLTARHASEAPVIAERCSRALTYTLLVSGPAACCVGCMKQSRSANNNTPHDPPYSLRCEYGDQMTFLRT